MTWMNRYLRLEHDGLPVFVDPDGPDWFVPSSHTDALWRAAQGLPSLAAAAADVARLQGEQADRLLLDYQRLEALLRAPQRAPYAGRAAHLRLDRLKELWFHLTNRCNLTCAHCLFSSGPQQPPGLGRAAVDAGLREAHGLGVRLFGFTGGEPFVYPDFLGLVRGALALSDDTHVVVLTNGTLLQPHAAALAALPRERVHLQISIDGLPAAHDAVRGAGAFERLRGNLDSLRSAGLPFTVAVVISRANTEQLTELVKLSAGLGATGLHLMYHFVRGRGSRESFVAPERIFAALAEASRHAEALGVSIDNIDTLASQVFSTPGTRHDLANAGWEALAVGPDGRVYPSTALVDVDEVACGRLDEGLESVWRQSPVLQRLRAASLVDSPRWRARPLRFLTGGGDVDHSQIAGGDFVGHDPYVELYELISLGLIVRRARSYPDQGLLRLRMGEVLSDCPDADEDGHDGAVCLTHCNCVVSLAGEDNHDTVRAFYGAAAVATNEGIVNSVDPAQGASVSIPQESRERSYGCGSPVGAAALQPAERVLDLGSGSGVECFVAAGEVGPEGRVLGVDMTDDMLALARRSREAVVQDLGYDNVRFERGLLEAIPAQSGWADAVLSNCVINLSSDKRRTFAEVLRVLRPGGRLVVSDVVTDGPAPPAVRNSSEYRGQCLGGAMEQGALLQLLRDSGFVGLRLVSRAPYRDVAGTQFFSLTYEARKPAVEAGLLDVMYRGPLTSARTDSGQLLLPGHAARLTVAEAQLMGDELFHLDATGAVTNVLNVSSCCVPAPAPSAAPVVTIGGLGDARFEAAHDACDCSAPPEAPAPAPITIGGGRRIADCMVCGEELQYSTLPTRCSCYYCGAEEMSATRCEAGHFVCDRCHSSDSAAVLEHLLVSARDTDLLGLMDRVRQHPAVPMHGPEHHALVPAVILSVARALGAPIGDEEIRAGLTRGAQVPGGVCGFWGVCGAAIGAGIAAAILLESTPVQASPRQRSQRLTARVMDAVADIEAGRCCQRESWVALTTLSALSGEHLGLHLPAEATVRCRQYQQNHECIYSDCPLWEARMQPRRRSERLPVVQGGGEPLGARS